MFLDLTFDQLEVLTSIAAYCPSLEMKHFIPLAKDYIKSNSGKVPDDFGMNLKVWLATHRPVFSVNGGSWLDILTKADYHNVVEWIEGEYGKCP